MEDFDRLKWAELKEVFKNSYGEYPTVISLLFLLGLEHTPDLNVLTKEQKQEVIHVGLCRLLETDGIYKYSHTDEEEWPHFILTDKSNNFDIEKQENYIKQKLINYFL